jgi:hypothetical protein
MVLDLEPPEITLAIRRNAFDFSFPHHVRKVEPLRPIATGMT